MSTTNQTKGSFVDWSGFQINVEKPIAKYLLQTITTGENGNVNQSEFQATSSKLLKVLEKSRVYVRMVLLLITRYASQKASRVINLTSKLFTLSAQIAPFVVVIG